MKNKKTKIVPIKDCFPLGNICPQRLGTKTDCCQRIRFAINCEYNDETNRIECKNGKGCKKNVD